MTPANFNFITKLLAKRAFRLLQQVNFHASKRKEPKSSLMHGTTFGK